MSNATKPPADAAAASEHKPAKRRSPNFPFIGLEESLSLVERLYKVENTGFAPVHVVVTKHWGYGLKSSAWKIRLAALAAFGLIESRGEGASKEIRLSERAKAILLDKVPDSSARAEALREAALAPTIYKEIRGKWGSQLGSDATVETYLVKDRGFLDDSAKAVLAQYKATIAYAKLDDLGNLESPPDGDDEEAEPEQPKRRAFKAERPSRGDTMRDFPITLPSLNVATLQVPHPMSEGDFTFLKGALEAFKDALTQRPSTPKKEAADGADEGEEGLGAD